MPRKHPDLTPWTTGSTRVDGIFGRMIEFQTYGENYVLGMRDNPATQRTITCAECGIVVPRNVPRLTRNGSWYAKGSLCIDCGKRVILRHLEYLKKKAEIIKESIALLNALSSCTDDIANNPKYAECLAMGKMLQIIKGQKQRG